jgi:ethanolamine utilization protein EutJ
VTEPNLQAWGADAESVLCLAEDVILSNPNGRTPHPTSLYHGAIRVGIDLGTAYTVLVVLSAQGEPLAGEYQFTQVVRDGLVVDFPGAVTVLRGMKKRVEDRLGLELTHAASGFPPAVPQAEVRATAHVVEAAGMQCLGLIDEPSAANNLLGLQEGAIVDIGGGTTGVAIIENGEVVYTADEATGGRNLSLVIAGASDLSFEAAEEIKRDSQQQSRLFPIVRPVMEKMGTIVEKHIRGSGADSIVLVGGTPLFPGMASVIEEITGLPTQVPINPMFVTPVGIAMHDRQDLH